RPIIHISLYSTAPVSSHAFISCSVPPRHLPSFPTRRSSDLHLLPVGDLEVPEEDVHRLLEPGPLAQRRQVGLVPRLTDDRRARGDRKSTRLNSSHEWISYAVFCLKKKKEKRIMIPSQQNVHK